MPFVTVIILCGGDNRRWLETGGVGRKELVPIFGVPLLARTIRQFKAEACNVLVAATNEELKAVAASENVTVLPCAETKTDTCLLNIEHWSEQTVFLCGDVVLDDYLPVELGLVHRPNSMPFFYGSFFTSEIYAAACEQGAFRRMKDWLQACNPGYGCLWNLYRVASDLPQHRHLLDPLTWRELPGPFVRDFDFKDQYEDWRRAFDPHAS